MNHAERKTENEQRFGVFYQIRQVCATLDNTPEHMIDELVAEHRILRVTTNDQVQIYPAFQFDNGYLDVSIAALVKILGDGGFDEWTVLYWLTTPINEMGGKTAVEIVRDSKSVREILRNGGDLSQLRALASNDAGSISERNRRT